MGCLAAIILFLSFPIWFPFYLLYLIYDYVKLCSLPPHLRAAEKARRAEAQRKAQEKAEQEKIKRAAQALKEKEEAEQKKLEFEAAVRLEVERMKRDKFYRDVRTEAEKRFYRNS